MHRAVFEPSSLNDLANQAPSLGESLSRVPSVYGSALVWALLSVLAAVIWALLERSERRTLQRQNVELCAAFQVVTEQHYRERLQAEERHLMTHDSTVRNILESLERTLLGKPRL